MCILLEDEEEFLKYFKVKVEISFFLIFNEGKRRLLLFLLSIY